VAAKELGPLEWDVSIVDDAGRPTPEFQRRWNTQRQNNALIGAGVSIGSGPPPATPIPKDGQEYIDTSTSPFTLYGGSGGVWGQVGEVLNLIGATQGDLLYRGATTWNALSPGAADEVLTTAGPTANPHWLGQAGFTFNFNGLPLDNQLLGLGFWARDITFHNSDARNIAKALLASTSTASLRMLSGTLTPLGTIDFTSSINGVVNWATDPYTHPAGEGLLLYAPTPNDASLASFAGRVVGYF
jgi:hypothetical protein